VEALPTSTCVERGIVPPSKDPLPVAPRPSRCGAAREPPSPCSIIPNDDAAPCGECAEGGQDTVHRTPDSPPPPNPPSSDAPPLSDPSPTLSEPPTRPEDRPGDALSSGRVATTLPEGTTVTILEGTTTTTPAEGEECALCIVDFEVGDTIRHLPCACLHEPRAKHSLLQNCYLTAASLLPVYLTTTSLLPVYL